MNLPLVLAPELRLSALVVTCGLLWVVESIAPLYTYRRGRLRRALPNLALTVLTVATNLILGIGSAALVAVANGERLGLAFAAGLPLWATLGVGIVGLDLAAYAAHVSMHRTKLGWRLHRVHHSDPEVDVTTALRQHPFESVWRIAFQLAGTLLLGLPLWVVGVYLALSVANAQLEHANLRLPRVLDRWLRLLVVTPDMHKVHHSRLERETDSNYSNILSVWDRLFGTYTAEVDFDRLRYGLDGFDDPQRQSLRALLGEPFTRRDDAQGERRDARESAV